MNTKVLILLAVAALAAADSGYAPPRRYSSGSSESASYESSEAKYDFQWSVEDASTGNDFDHQEARDGEHTQGSYSVYLPDGRRQTVTYLVDGDDGYVAEVHYEGEARYPDSNSYESFESFESYRPPRPAYSYDSNESK